MSAEPDYLPADALAEDEPKYLRRQKPVEIRKRKFSRKTWPLYRRILVGSMAALIAGFAIYEAAAYLLYSPDVRFEGNFVWVDCAADLGRTVTRCAKHDMGGMEGLIGVPGTIGGALRMNAGAYGTQIGTFVREVQVFRASSGQIETLRGSEINFEYRHTSFAPDDIMLAVKLELHSKPFREILSGIRICNEKRR